jgi:PAS domain S-box-containing protein
MRRDRSLPGGEMRILSTWWRSLRATFARRAPVSAPNGIQEQGIQEQGIQEQLDASLARLAAVNYRLKLYFERAPLASIVWGPDQLVREWNPAAESMFGYTAAEAIGRNVYELTATPEGLQSIERVREKFLAGEPFPDVSIVKNRRKDGTEIYCEWYFTIVAQFSDALNGVIAFGTDITARIKDEEERRQLETNLRQAQKMQSLGTLAGGIAHDFNNILLAIAGNTKLAMQELPSEHSAQRSLLEVSKASARASSIVNQILMFGRREDRFERVPVSLRTIVEEVLALLRATLPARIAIRTTIADELPDVNADPGQLHQVLLNLATNGAHAIGDRAGSLDIRIRMAQPGADALHRLHLSQSGRYVKVSVSDSGIGMTAAVLDRIFEPFFTTKPRGQGTGLGLAVVHGIVRAHDGAIDVSSTPESGSTFDVYLPVMSGSTPELVTPAQSVQRGSGQQILYVDDEEALVYLITRVLERLGYQVAGFTDANAALAAFRATPDAYDALVTDLSMPSLSGNDLAKQVLAIRPQLPVVMTSGYVRTEDRALALTIGVRELVMKPNTVDALGLALHRLLNAAAQRGQEASASASKIT